MFHPDFKLFDATLAIVNEGATSVTTAFKVVFGYDYYDDEPGNPPALVYHERNVTTPSPIDIPPGATYSLPFNDILFVARRNHAQMSPYNFSALVDADAQINETNEADNNLVKSMVLSLPLPHTSSRQTVPASSSG